MRKQCWEVGWREGNNPPPSPKEQEVVQRGFRESVMEEGWGKTREVSGVRRWEETNVFISWWGGTLHLPLRSVVMDRVTGGISTPRKREKYIYITKRNGESKRQRNGRRRKERRGRPSFSQEGNVQGGKVETGWRGESTQGSEEGHIHPHTNWSKIILVDKGLEFKMYCMCCMFVFHISTLVCMRVCFLYAFEVHLFSCECVLSVSLGAPAMRLTDKYKPMRCMTVWLKSIVSSYPLQPLDLLRFIDVNQICQDSTSLCGLLAFMPTCNGNHMNYLWQTW